MSTVNDIRKDILDSGTLTANGSSDVNGPWVSTEGADSVVVLFAPSVALAAVGMYVEESNDQSTILRISQPGAVDASGSRVSGTITPGAAFLRVLFQQTTSGTTLNYSVRAVA